MENFETYSRIIFQNFENMKLYILSFIQQKQQNMQYFKFTTCSCGMQNVLHFQIFPSQTRS